MMYDILAGILLGVIITLIALYTYWTWRESKTIVLDDPTDDEDYLALHHKLRCPGCDSYDYRVVEIDDLPWLKDEDKYCICNRCGRQFGNEK